MILDGCSDYYKGTNAILSSVNTRSFSEFLCVPEEMTESSGRHLPALTHDDSEKKWRSTDESALYGKQQPHYYQGVRVKNTVKKLIQKRLCDIQTFPKHESESDYPVLTSILQVNKRPSINTFSPVEAKRPITNHNDIKSQQRLAQADNVSPALPELMIRRLPCSPPFTDTVMVQNGPSPSTLPPALSPALPELMISRLPCSPLFTDTVMVQNGPSPSTLPLLDNKNQTPLLAIPNNSLFAPRSQAQTVKRTSSSPLQYEIAQSQPILQESPTQVSFLHWQIQQEEERLAGLIPERLTAQDEDGDTFLHIAVAQGRRAVAYVLAKKMADIGVLDIKEHNDQSALQLSVAANQHLITQDLLSLGAQVNTMDYWGRSPLHVCAEKGHINTLKAIQKYMQSSGQQINVDVMNYEGLTPLHTAVLSHNAVVQELASEEPLSLQAMALAQKRKLLRECIQMLLAMGAYCGTKDCKSGRTALHMAAEEANMELLWLFLDQPQSLSIINQKAYNGNTALHLASSLQGRVTQVDAVKLLMRRGADPSAKNLENEQPAQLVQEGMMGEQVRCVLKGRGVEVQTTLL